MTHDGCLFLDDSTQPTVLETLQRVLRALEIVEGAEADTATRVGVIKAKGVVRLFANIWGAEFEEEGVEGLLARGYAERAAPMLGMVKKPRAKEGENLAKLMAGLKRMNGGVFSAPMLAKETRLELAYVSTTCSKLTTTGRLKRAGVGQSSQGRAVNLYEVAGI